MYKDSSMKKKEKKKRFRCEVSELYELTSHVNHMISFDIIFFWCDLHNVKIESLTVYTLVSLSKEKTALNEKWVYTIKLNENDEIAQYKIKWMIKKF